MGCFASALETSQFAVEGVDEGASGLSANGGERVDFHLCLISTLCTTSCKRPMCSDVSSLSVWMCSRSLFDRSLDADVLLRNKIVCSVIAALWDQRDIVNSLCGSRTDANKANQDGTTPLRTIALQQLEEMIATCRFAVYELCWMITLTSSVLFVRRFLGFEQLQTRHIRQFLITFQRCRVTNIRIQTL